jgi:CheY-like chemotaxis protein
VRKRNKIIFCGDSLLSVLLVEDYLPISDLIVSIVEEGGKATVQVRSTPEEALAFLERLAKTGGEFPQLVLIDLSLPGMNGYELLETIWEKYPQLLCIILSSHNRMEMANEACCFWYFKSGSSAFCVKSTRKWLIQNTFPQQIELRPTIHLPLEKLETIDLTFCLSLTPT